MTKVEQNKYSMFSAIESILGKFQPMIGSQPMLKECSDNFTNVLDELRDKDNTYLNVKKGSREDKDTAKERLIDELTAKAGALFVFARKTGNGNLKAVTEVTRSGLERLRDPELLQKAKVILENFRENLEELKKNGMTDQSLADLDKAVNNFDTAIGKKDSKQAEGKASRKDLNEIFDEADDILKNDLDRLVELVKNDSPDFYNQYKAARVIKDLGQPKSNPQPDKAEKNG
jgi:hypothetical protein